MFPRRSAIGRYLIVVTFFICSLWMWIDITGQHKRLPWQIPKVMSVPQSVISIAHLLDGHNNNASKQSHHHSNQTLEEFRKNMTLLKVNMTGVLDRIKQANGSEKIHVLHGPERHYNAVNPHNFNYILNTPHMCKDKDVFALVYIHTAPSHYKRRMVIRQTWGNPQHYKGVKIRLIFVMGKVEEDVEAQSALLFEHEQYHDIVQEDFKDTYKNLTYKGIAALKWISTYCSQAKFVIKSDDDIFVNMFTLLRHLQSMDKHGVSHSGMIMCLVWYRMTVMREGKWKVSKDQFKDDYYPVYCSGSAFTMTMDAVLRLHEVSYHVPFFWVDDFYITGLLPLKAGNITHKQFMSTYVLDGRKLEEKFTGPQWFTYIFSHVHNLNLIQSVWDRMVQLAKGQVSAKVKYALPGHLPDDKELYRKEKEEEKQREERGKKEREKKEREKKEREKKEREKKKEEIEKKKKS